MLRKTNEVTKQGKTIYVDENGKKQLLLRVNHKKFSNTIPNWCWNFIQPIRATGNHWNLNKNRMELSTK